MYIWLPGQVTASVMNIAGIEAYIRKGKTLGSTETYRPFFGFGMEGCGEWEADDDGAEYDGGNMM